MTNLSVGWSGRWGTTRRENDVPPSPCCPGSTPGEECPVVKESVPVIKAPVERGGRDHGRARKAEVKKHE
ncbi:MAG: hypothetical protein ACLSDJ_02770 [Butyricimonas faecihominis]